MNSKPGARISLLLTLALVSAPPSSGQDATPARTLEGVWEGKRDFGPWIRGTLDVTRSNGATGTWRARIAQYDLPLALQDGRLSVELPGEQGSFVGRIEKDGSRIRGHWIQPGTVNDGSKFASPVLLLPHGKDRWRGEVVPLQDEWTVYLVVSRRPDGSLGAFLRNPDRNIGVFWRVERLEREGNRIKLMGKPGGPGARAADAAETVIFEGVYHPDAHRMTFFFEGRGGTYDFAPIADDPGSGFYARGREPAPYRYQPPVAEDDGWPVGTLDEVGMAPDLISELVRTISAPATSVHDFYLHGLLIARHGKLVLEEYFHGFHRSKPHETRSASKSVGATLVGAAIQDGAKLDTSTPVYDLIYQGKLPADLDPRKKKMTVEHLLTMSSGYYCDDDGDPPPPGSENVMTDDRPDPNYYRYTLQLPMEMEPGAEAVYCSINPNLLGAVLTAATGRPLVELFHDLLAEPMKIRRYHLNLQPTGEPYLGGGQKLLPRDFMKFGQLMLDGGVWKGKRILSKEFALRASTPLVTMRYATDRTKPNYGYLWWMATYPYKDRTVSGYFASGNGGQTVLVIPELDMVIAFFAGNYADRPARRIHDEFVPKFILPALEDPSR